MTIKSARGISRFALLVAAAGTLASCGGGGGGGDAFADGADASGIWFGTIHVDFTSGDVPAVLIARTNGDFYLDSNISLLIGDASTTNNALSATADGYSYNDYFQGGLEFTLSGTVNEGDAVNGAFSSSAQSGTMTFDYESTLSTMPASLNAIAGTYQGSIWILSGAVSATIPIEANGDFTFTASGCTVKGSLKVLDAAHNLYEWSAKLSGDCPTNGSAKGIAFGFGPEGVYFVGKVGRSAVYFGGFIDGDSMGAGPAANAPSVSGAGQNRALEFMRSRLSPRSRSN